jgi:hypothetical protein
MKNITSSRGFSAGIILVFVLVGGIVATAGYIVSRKEKITERSQSDTTKVAETTKSSPSKAPTNEETSTTPSISPGTTPAPSSTKYSFTELGISMDILQGWSVKKTTATSYESTGYAWEVAKPGVDGKISLSSGPFLGGFEGCESSKFYDAEIKEAIPLSLYSLRFMNWSTTSEGVTNSYTKVVRSDASYFYPPGAPSKTVLPAVSVGVGKYVYCPSLPDPGFDLEISKLPGFVGAARVDRIEAVKSSSSDKNYQPLSNSSPAYADVRTMMTSIK